MDFRIANRSAWVIILMLAICLGPQNSTAQIPTTDVLRVYLNEGLTEVMAYTETIPDTVTAYFVLENPSQVESLSKCQVSVGINRSEAFDWHSDTGQVTSSPYGNAEIIFDPPLVLGPKNLLATARFAIQDLQLSQIYIWGGALWETMDQATMAPNRPYTTSVCAWLNPGTPQVTLDPVTLDFGDRGYGTLSRLHVAARNDGDAPLFLTPQFGPGCGAFTCMDSAYLDIILPDSERHFEFFFSPDAVGDYFCDFLLAPDLVLELAGAGRVPIYSLAGPDTVASPPTPVGGFSHLVVTIENDGDFPITVFPEIPDSCTIFRNYEWDVPHLIQPGRLSDFYLEYQAPDLLTHYCDVTFGDTLLTITAVGSGRPGLTNYVVDPDSLHFPGCGVGDIATEQFTIRNTGEVALYPIFQFDDPADVFSLQDDLTGLEIRPGGYQNIAVNFSPRAVGFYQASLSLGDSMSTVQLSGTGFSHGFDLQSNTGVLHFDPTNPGETDTQVFLIKNVGPYPRAFEPTSTSPYIIDLSPGELLNPGESAVVSATYRPWEYGQFEFKIMLNPEYEFWINCIATPRLDFLPDQNRIGFYFDQDLTQIDHEIDPTPQSVTAYLAFANPSDPTGIGGWECAVNISAGAAMVGYELAGNHINASEGNEFTVGLGLEPLPYSPAVILGSFEFVIWDMTQEEFSLELQPTTHSSIPGMMSWVPWSDLTDLTPMLPLTGQPTVAWIRWNTAVGTSAPTPTLAAQANGVVLTWPNSAPEGAGYHVYRRVDEGPATRLTPHPLTSTNLTMTYQDIPTDVPQEATLHYSYRLVIEGMETNQSPEVDFAYQGEMPQVTRLLPNAPNPFNPQTTVFFELAEASRVQINIYDLTGRRVRQLENTELPAGRYQRIWAGRDDHGHSLPSGAYHMRLETGTKVDTRKIMLLK